MSEKSMQEGLEHIIKVCRLARTQSRRTRWIEARARSAINGDNDWKFVDYPKSSKPLIEAAPDLLKALEVCVQSLSVHGAERDMALAIIAKAKGES